MEIFTGVKDYQQAWQQVIGQLQLGMKRSDYKTWVDPIVPLGFNGNPNKFRLAVMNEYNRQIILNRLNSQIANLLSGFYQRDIEVEVIVSSLDISESSQNRKEFNSPQLLSEREERQPAQKKPAITSQSSDVDLDETSTSKSKRKLVLQQAYGDKRARLIQPDKGIYVTKYFLEKWLPLLGHSALIVVMIIRKVCYWNPYTGEKRDILETEMGELAEQACISVRTLKTVLKNELIKRYFIRYTVRRVMTPNGIRTAGIRLQVRMDDPLTPEDQAALDEIDAGTWYLPEFEDEHEDYDL